MAKLISTAQKTFVDLYDSYVLNIGSDIVAVPCDQDGAAIEDYRTSIPFSATRGTKAVDCTCTLISGRPTGLAITPNQEENVIKITVVKGTILDDSLKMEFKFTTDDNNAFVFNRYITFIKIKAGADGGNIVTFRIYSENGDTFQEGLENITMKVAAFDGLTPITEASYQWAYYDTKWEEVNAEGENGSTLTVSNTMEYANSVFRCVMTYNNQTYEDYFTLKTFNHQYDAVIKFFDGSNIFDASEPFIVAYIELYKDQKKIDGLDESVTKYYYHPSNTFDAETKKSTFNASGLSDNDKIAGNKIYGIYKVVNPPDAQYVKYIARLLTCREDGAWGGLPTNREYVYRNDLYSNDHIFDTTTSVAPNIVVISKESVVKYKDVNFTVYASALDDDETYIYDDDLIIARNNVTVIDLNDPVISATEPTDPKDGQLWLDTSTSPYILYVYENGKWVYFTQQNGKTIYTSRPSSYSEGDLWILAQGEMCGSFGEGTMLRAKQSASTFSASHWEDAMSALTTMYNNIEQTFTFNPNNEKGKLPGLTIGQIDNAFYVNINSQKMSFYDNSEKQNKEVVYISNESANIDGLVVETSLDVNCNATFLTEEKTVVQFGNFAWQVEGNGSLSLAIPT